MVEIKTNNSNSVTGTKGFPESWPLRNGIPGRWIWWLLLLPALLTAYSRAEAGYTLSGVVRSQQTGLPLALVNISVVGTETGDASDQFGAFVIPNVPAGKQRLNFSHIGFKPYSLVLDVERDTVLQVTLEEAFFLMDEVVVTSTRTAKIFREVPVATEVISRKDIEDSGALDMGELLAARAGVTVTTTVTGESVISLNGMDARYVLVLVDGQPVTGKFDGRASLDQIPTDAVRKVEILKGPNSALYGSEAMGGVINIITEKPTTAGRLSVSARFAAGDGHFQPTVPSSGRRNIRLDFRKKIGSVSLGSNLDWNHNNMDDNNLHINVDNIRKINTRNQLEWHISDAQSLIVGLNYYADEENSNTNTVLARAAVRRFTPELRHQWSLGSGWEISEYYHYTDYRRDYEQVRPWGTPVLFDHTGEKLHELEINAVRSTPDFTINMGSELSRDEYRSDRIPDGQQSLAAASLYGQLDYRLVRQVNMVLGVRLDRNQEVGTVTSPRLALFIPLSERWKMRATVGRGFRMPTFLDRYIDWTHEAFGYRIEGNPDLKPEKSTGYTIGLDYYHPMVYQISIMFYGTRFSQMINDYVAAPNVFSYRNLDRVQHSGLEVQGRWRISNQMTASWGLNYLDNRDLNTNELIPNTKPFTMSFQWSVQDQRGKAKVTLKSKFVGAYYTSVYIPELGDFYRSETPRRPYAITDLITSWQWTNRVTVKGGITNVSNTTHDVYGPFIGRQYYLELTVSK